MRSTVSDDGCRRKKGRRRKKTSLQIINWARKADSTAGPKSVFHSMREQLSGFTIRGTLLPFHVSPAPNIAKKKKLLRNAQLRETHKFALKNTREKSPKYLFDDLSWHKLHSSLPRRIADESEQRREEINQKEKRIAMIAVEAAAAVTFAAHWLRLLLISLFFSLLSSALFLGWYTLIIFGWRHGATSSSWASSKNLPAQKAREKIDLFFSLFRNISVKPWQMKFFSISFLPSDFPAACVQASIIYWCNFFFSGLQRRLLNAGEVDISVSVLPVNDKSPTLEFFAGKNSKYWRKSPAVRWIGAAKGERVRLQQLTICKIETSQLQTWQMWLLPAFYLLHSTVLFFLLLFCVTSLLDSFLTSCSACRDKRCWDATHVYKFNTP